MGEYPNFALLGQIVEQYGNETALLDFLKSQGKLSSRTIDYIRKAIAFMTVIDKRKRDNGDLYISHYIGATAIGAVHCGIVDPEILIAIFFHDCKEDFPLIWASIVSRVAGAGEFTPRIVSLVEGVSKPDKPDDVSTEDWLTAYFLNIDNSLDLVSVKLPEAMHNLLTLDGRQVPKQIKKAAEYKRHYNPLAIKYDHQFRLADGYREGIQVTDDRLARITTP